MKRKGFSCSFQLILKGSGFSSGWLSDAGTAAGGDSRAPAHRRDFPATGRT